MPIRSITSINEELEQILTEIREINKVNKKEDLEEYKSRVDELRKQLEGKNKSSSLDKAEIGRYEQPTRTYKNIRDVYNEIIKAANILIDAGIDVGELKEESLAGKDEYKASLDEKSVAVLEVITSGSKGFAGDKHLLELQQKELQRQEGIKEEYINKKKEIDVFVGKVGEVDIDTYMKNNEIVVAIKEINTIVAEINALKAENDSLEKEQTDIIKKMENAKTDKTKNRYDKLLQGNKSKIENNSKLIKEKNINCKELAAKFSKNKNFSSMSILDASGELNYAELEKLNKTTLPQAEAKKEAAARELANKISIKAGNLASAMADGGRDLFTVKELKMYLPSLNGDFSYDNVKENMDSIIRDINIQGELANDYKRNIDKIDRDITAIKGSIGLLEGRTKQTGNATKNISASDNYFSGNVKSAREYEANGVTIDQVYLNKSFMDRYKDRVAFANSVYPKNIRFKWLRSHLRAIFNSRDIQYAMSYKKAQKQIEETTIKRRL